jgi:hypothetical protein
MFLVYDGEEGMKNLKHGCRKESEEAIGLLLI